MTPLDPHRSRHRTRRRTRLLGALVAVLVMAGCGSDEADDAGDAPRLEEAGDVVEAEHHFVIPPGTGARLDAGEEVDILPRRLRAEVGETIRIANEDDRGHVVGVFFVGAGETLTQTFTSPGKFSGSCTVHTDGEFTLEVTE